MAGDSPDWGSNGDETKSIVAAKCVTRQSAMDMINAVLLLAPS